MSDEIKALLSIDCWSCGTFMTLDERSENDGDCPSCSAEIDLELYLAKVFVGYAERDARIAELELLAAAISADCNDMANERNQFRAELAALKFELEVAKTDELSAAVWAATETIKHELWDAQAEIVKRDARIATQEAQIKALQSGENCWQSGYDEGRRMGGKHCMCTIDQLRAELAAAKETISRYETTAENCDLLRAELAAIKGQEPVAADVFQFLTAVMDAAGLVRHGRQSKELSDYLGKECARLRCSLASPAPSAVVPAVPDGAVLVGRAELSLIRNAAVW